MKREVIQDFLNLPGIAGIALMDGHSRPYFCGVDQNLNFQQKEALAQGVLQVVKTIPDGFQSFEFQFKDHQVYIYKLNHSVILLVLAHEHLVYSDYLKSIKDLKAVLQEDISNAIATFRLITGNLTLTSFQKQQKLNATSGSEVSTELSSSVESSDQAASSAPLSVPLTNTRSEANTRSTTASAIVSGTDLQAALVALNYLSQFTTDYLGTQVIVHYWKISRPGGEWLNRFQIDRSAQFSFNGVTSSSSSALSAQEQEWICEWIAAFIKRCSQVVRDFSTIVEHKAESEGLKELLSHSR